MAGNSNGKLRVLYVMQMLQDETDGEHGLTMAEIIERLAELGLEADRKTIYTDFDTLREFGLSIEKAHCRPVEYYLDHRDFSFDELSLMVDAVQSFPFVTQRQSDQICRNLKLLATDRQREKLNRRIHVDNRARGRNDAVLRNVDVIHDALRAKRRIVFSYWKVGIDGKPCMRGGGDLYEVTPMRVTLADGFYYLTAWSEKHACVREYRVDRMRDVAISQERARRNSEISEYEYRTRDSQYFGRFDGALTSVKLECNENGVGIVHDRFGQDVQFSAKDENRANAQVMVRVSPQFFGWVAGMDGAVKITGPKKLVKEYKDYLRKLAE